MSYGRMKSCLPLLHPSIARPYGAQWTSAIPFRKALTIPYMVMQSICSRGCSIYDSKCEASHLSSRGFTHVYNWWPPLYRGSKGDSRMVWHFLIAHSMHELWMDEVLFATTSSVHSSAVRCLINECHTILESPYKRLHGGAICWFPQVLNPWLKMWGVTFELMRIELSKEFMATTT